MYEVTIPNFRLRKLNLATLGLAPRNFRRAPFLWMDRNTLAAAKFFGLSQRRTSPEITLFTSIPFKYFTDIIELGTVKAHCKVKADALKNYTGKKFPMAQKRKAQLAKQKVKVLV